MTPEPDGGESVRWEARSHQQIYDEVCNGAGPYPVAETARVWEEIAASLGEVRVRFDEAVRRLLATSAGANANAADDASRLVRRGLTDAQDLARQAGARRAWLSERNEGLRNAMPAPVPPAEHASGFTGLGTAWLLAPNFHSADQNRQVAAERARDLMRQYEADIRNEHLASTVDTPHPYLGDEQTQPRFGPIPDRTTDFGPLGYAESDPDVDDAPPDENPTQPITGAPQGIAPPWRSDGSPIASLFEVDANVPPPVIGE